MTTEGRLTRDLPGILGDLATGPYPEYIEDVLATSATIRQRPAWTFPERWLPMVDLVRQPVLVPRVPWRSIALAIVVLLALLAAAIVYVGSQQRVPAPFGPARNGLIAYAADGDIYTADPASGAATAIVTGPGTDAGPQFSLDGTHLAFARTAAGGTTQIFVARSDGGGLTLVTPTPVSLAAGDSGRGWERYKFSPDGRELLIATDSGMTIARTDGSGTTNLEVGMHADEPTFRPPDGRQILFIGRGAETGLFILDRATNQHPARRVSGPGLCRLRSGPHRPERVGRPRGRHQRDHGARRRGLPLGAAGPEPRLRLLRPSRPGASVSVACTVADRGPRPVGRGPRPSGAIGIQGRSAAKRLGCGVRVEELLDRGDLAGPHGDEMDEVGVVRATRGSRPDSSATDDGHGVALGDEPGRLEAQDLLGRIPGLQPFEHTRMATARAGRRDERVGGLAPDDVVGKQAEQPGDVACAECGVGLVDDVEGRRRRCLIGADHGELLFASNRRSRHSHGILTAAEYRSHATPNVAASAASSLDRNILDAT